MSKCPECGSVTQVIKTETGYREYCITNNHTVRTW